ncbi:MAG: hypothetical protein AB7U95_03205 [Reyranella sp.]
MQERELLITRQPPPALLNAFVTLSGLHEAVDRHPRTVAGSSRKSCVFSARTAALFLNRAGFSDAAAVCCVLFAVEFDREKKPIGTEKIGDFNNAGATTAGEIWNGHMVVTVAGYLFDPTLAQIKLERFPQMIAHPLQRVMFQQQPTFSAVGMTRNNRYIELYWLEASGSWAKAQADQMQICSEVAADLHERHSIRIARS